MSACQPGDAQERFAFGENWTRFLKTLDERRIESARQSLCRLLHVDDLRDRRFLDVGSGSGLSSLVARRLGAQVHSFDYDASSVACTRELRRRYFDGDPGWTIEQGSILDRDYVRGLGAFDIVYSWGVLHHTGNMDSALEHVQLPVASDGLLALAIYNDQGRFSRWWASVKRTHVRASPPVRLALELGAMAVIWTPSVLVNTLTRGDPFRDWREYNAVRGMSPWYDHVDWVGGHPFEVARPEDIFRRFRDAGFVLEEMTTCGGGKGCNEFVFRRDTA